MNFYFLPSFKGILGIVSQHLKNKWEPILFLQAKLEDIFLFNYNNGLKTLINANL